MKSYIKIIIAALSILLIVGLGLGAYSFVQKTNHQFANVVLPNTVFEGISLGGKSKDEVNKILNDRVKELDQTAISIKVDDKVYKVLWKALGVTYNGTDIVEKIFKAQMAGTFFERLDLKKQAEAGTRKLDFVLTPVVDEKKIQTYVKDNFSKKLAKPVNANIIRKDEEFQVVPGKNGREIDQMGLSVSIKNAIVTKQDATVTAPQLVLRPKRTTEMMKKVKLDDVIGEYKTSFSKSAPASVFNAKLGTKYLSDALIAPGEEFSFLDKVGIVNKEAGYIESKTYTAGKVTTGVGGGVCQVSSTLYNAALLADLEITSRSNHSRPVAYVPYGLDAAISSYGPDLRFVNNTGKYIYLTAHTTDKELIVQFHGESTGKKVVLSSKVDYKDKKVLKASAYKTVLKDGVVVSKTKLRKSTYKLD